MFDQMRGAGATIRRMFGFLFGELERSDTLLTNEIAIRSFEENLALCLLLGLPHNYSERIGRQKAAAAPANVRRAEAFMQANASMPLTIAKIAEAAGCSVRALQIAFHRFRGTTPIQVLHRPGTTNQQWFGFGATVYSAAAGEVVFTHDGLAEDIPFELPTLQTPQDQGGNFVIVRIAPHVYAFYAHLMTGSVAVSVGDHVAAGAKIAQLGNTGNSLAPHLHFGLYDRPDFLTGYSLPFVFANYVLTGLLTGGTANAPQIKQLVERSARLIRSSIASRPTE